MYWLFSCLLEGWNCLCFLLIETRRGTYHIQSFSTCWINGRFHSLFFSSVVHKFIAVKATIKLKIKRKIDWLAWTSPWHKWSEIISMANTVISFMKRWAGEVKNIGESRLTALRNYESRSPPLVVLAKDFYSSTYSSRHTPNTVLCIKMFI